MEFDSNNEFDDHAFLDVVVNDGSDEGGSVTQDFCLEEHANCMRQRDNFMSSVTLQGNAKHVTDTVDIFALFISRKLTDMTVNKSKR